MQCIDPLPDSVSIDRELVRQGGLREFVEMAFPEVEPCPFVPGWHIDAICDHLEAITNGDIRSLVINIPPGCMKSLLVSVLWPAWEWIAKPSTKWIYASYSGNLTRRDALRTRNLINSQWFQDRWGFELNPLTERPDCKHPIYGSDSVCIPWQSTRAAMFFENNHRGFRFSTSVGGEVTGRHANRIVVDDPNKAQAAEGGLEASGKDLQRAIDFWSGTLTTRQADPKTTSRVLIMQRLHEKDLAGVVKEQGFESLVLPMEFEPENRCYTSIGFRDPRVNPGDLLCPDRFGPDEVAELKRTMTDAQIEAQLQQNPNPAGGTIFKSDYLTNEYDVLPDKIQMYLSVDCAFKDNPDSDNVAFQLWGKSGDRLYYLKGITGKFSFDATCQMIADIYAAYPKILKILIEDAANGPAVINTMTKRINGITPVTPLGGKIARANAVSPYFRDGLIWYPRSEKWGKEGLEYREEMRKFPRGANDDRVDATTQFVLFIHGSIGDKLKQAMDKIKAKGRNNDREDEVRSERQSRPWSS